MEFFSIKVWDNFTIKEIHQRFFAVNFDIGVWDFTCILKSITVLFLSHFDIVMILHIKKINTLSSQSVSQSEVFLWNCLAKKSFLGKY